MRFRRHRALESCQQGTFGPQNWGSRRRRPPRSAPGVLPAPESLLIIFSSAAGSEVSDRIDHMINSRLPGSSLQDRSGMGMSVPNPDHLGTVSSLLLLVTTAAFE